MEGVVLFGGFLAIVLFGYFLAGKLDCFLNSVQPSTQAKGDSCSLKIAISNPCALAPVARALKELQGQYPDIEIKMYMGKEWEIMRDLESGVTDIAVVSAEAEDSGQTHSACFICCPQPLSVDSMTLMPADTENQRQKLLWKDIQSPIPIQKLVQRLCGRSD